MGGGPAWAVSAPLPGKGMYSTGRPQGPVWGHHKGDPQRQTLRFVLRKEVQGGVRTRLRDRQTAPGRPSTRLVDYPTRFPQLAGKSSLLCSQFAGKEAEAQAGQGLPLDHIGSKYWLQTPASCWRLHSFLSEGTSGPVTYLCLPHPTPQNPNS